MDGPVADAVLGQFQKGKEQFAAVLEGKGPRSAVPPICGAAHVCPLTRRNCGFCEDRGPLSAESLKHTFEHRDPYNPRPVWPNFRGLFRDINEGNAGLNIPPTMAAF